MWVLLMIVFSQPYHVATVDILGTYSDKEVCVSEQKRATTIRTPTKSSFGCVKIDGVKNCNRHKMKLEDLKQDLVNARKHNPRNVNMIVDSIQELGCGRSILIDENGKIIAGNATYEALVEAGITKVRVVEGNGDEIIAVQRSDLTTLEKARLSLYDNRTSELSRWDTEVLKPLAELDNLFENIFSDKELAVILGDDYGPAIEEKSGMEPSGVAVVVCPKCQHEFKPT